MVKITDIFTEFWNYEYKWFIMGGALLLVVLIIVIIPKGKKKKETIKKEVIVENVDSLKTAEAKEETTKNLDEVEKTTEIKEETTKIIKEPQKDETPEYNNEINEEQSTEDNSQNITKKEEPQKEQTLEHIIKTESLKDNSQSGVEEKVEKVDIQEPAKNETTPLTEIKKEDKKITSAETDKKFDGKKEVKESKYIGKWIIKRKSLNDFVLYLIASNGEIILTSESYANIPGAKLGLQTVKKNIALGRFQIHSDKNNHYFFKLKDSANKLLGLGQVYSTKKQCSSSISSVKRFSQNADLVKNVYDDMTYIEYNGKEEINVENVKDAYRGKWIIEKDDTEYQAKLIASNGEVLLVTERYASTNSVHNAIDIIKTNAANNNFIIDSDKNKKFFYRLRNSAKLTLCIGEAYENKASCINSIESVKRFCITAEIFEEIKD